MKVGNLIGERIDFDCKDPVFPPSLASIPDPPKRLYVVGNPAALCEGLAVVGARRATPYGLGCAQRFSRMAAEKGVVVISGGARGCDAEAHRAALAAQMPTVVFLGGGCDRLYPSEHRGLFQQVIDFGGAVVSENSWDTPPLPYMFRARNRLIAGLAKAVLIVEAGLPSGTFSTADEALAANRDVLVVPGAITSASSRGANRLLYQGAIPIVDDESFEDALFSLFGCLKHPPLGKGTHVKAKDSVRREADNPLVRALLAETLSTEQLYSIARDSCNNQDPHVWLMECLVEAERAGLVARYPDGRWGPRGHG